MTLFKKLTLEYVYCHLCTSFPIRFLGIFINGIQELWVLHGESREIILETHFTYLQEIYDRN